MISVIIYAEDSTYLDKTIADIIDHTPELDNIFVCDDTGISYKNKDVIVHITQNVGRAKAWNEAASLCDSDTLVFIRDTTSVSDGWLPEFKHNAIATPKIYSLNTEFWIPEHLIFDKIGWRWDLNLYNRVGVECPVASSHCIAIKNDWFKIIGGFDDKINGNGSEDIEISIRSWLFGGSVQSLNSHIACGIKIDQNNIDNKVHVVEKWFPQYASYLYNYYGISRSRTNIGSIYAKPISRQATWYLHNVQPELLKIYQMYGIAHGKTVAVVAPGHSLDTMNKAIIARYDIIIGVDQAAEQVQCDYVVCDNINLIAELLKKYQTFSMVVPTTVVLNNHQLLELDVNLGGCHQYEPMSMPESVLHSAYPPFHDFLYTPCAAIQLALFMKPESITMFGFDTAKAGDSFHITNLKHKKHGTFDPNTVELGIKMYSKLASTMGIPLFRMNHA